MNYLAFRTQILSRTERVFEVAAWSPAGEGAGEFELAINGQESATLVAMLDRQSLRRHLRPRPDAVSARWSGPAEVGEWLFGLIFQGEILRLYERSVDLLGADQQLGLRLEIAYDPRDGHLGKLQSLPWELMRQPGTPEFLALNPRRPVVRYSTIPRRAHSLTAPPKLRILVVASSPEGYPPLDLEREKRNLTAALRSDGRIALVLPEAATLDAVRTAFKANRCHVVHFMGHGGLDLEKDGVLVFETRDHKPQLVRGEDLANKLGDSSDLSLVCLNSCQSARIVDGSGGGPMTSVALSMVCAGIPAVVAMQCPISDPAAIEFSRAFYRHLARGEPVEAAVTEGRQSIHSARPDTAEWAIPVLFQRGAGHGLPNPARRARRIRIGAAVGVVVLSFLGLGALAIRQDRAAELVDLNNAGYALFGEGEETFDEARRLFEEALRRDPEYAPVHSNLSLLESASGNEDAAMEHAQAAVDAAPDVALYHYNLGQLLLQGRRYEEAQAALEHAIALAPDDAAALNELGRVYLDLGHLTEARAVLVRGLANAPGMAPLHKNLGHVALAENNAAEALDRFSESLRLARQINARLGICEALLGLVLAEQLAGHREEACYWLGELQQNDPKAALVQREERQELSDLACPTGG